MTHSNPQRISLPEPLRLALPDLPSAYVQGSENALQLLDDLPERGLAVVGTRQPQTRSIQLVKETLRAIKKSRLIVISGMARGIDAAAHEAALENHLPTIAILGSGLNKIYPPENLSLAHAILENDGLLVSEYPLDYQPRPHTFLKRNRIIAAWSKLAWIVEASFRSGAVNTATWSKDMNRSVLATPCFPGDPHFAGTQALLDRLVAHPFWGPHSLGCAWLELATLPYRKSDDSKRDETPPFSLFPDAAQIREKVRKLARSQGGCTVTEALHWALELGWEPSRFFAGLQDSLRLGWIEDHGGVLVTS